MPGRDCLFTNSPRQRHLPEEFLRRLGMSDTSYARKPAVRIPYRASGGTEVAVRFRIAAEGADKFRWAKGSKAIPYGLDRLSDARDAGHVVIVEGESDAATLWFHDIPAIGLPGATTWNEDRDAPLFDGIGTIYVVIEPDTGGAAVVKWLSRSSIRPRARLVRLHGAKDASELYLADPDGFKAAFQRALDDAQPCPEPETKKAKDDDTRAGRALVLHEPEPWPQPVDGAELLDEIASGIRRYVVFDAARRGCGRLVVPRHSRFNCLHDLSAADSNVAGAAVRQDDLARCHRAAGAPAACRGQHHRPGAFPDDRGGASVAAARRGRHLRKGQRGSPRHPEFGASAQRDGHPCRRERQGLRAAAVLDLGADRACLDWQPAGDGDGPLGHRGAAAAAAR